MMGAVPAAEGESQARDGAGGRHHTHRERKDQTGGASEIKNSVAVFQLSKNKGLRASEIKVKMMA
jgi:hypothetical protein